jgi:transposase
VYRVADRFIAEGPAGLADRRQDNGAGKVDDRYVERLRGVLVGSPRDFGFRRPTWTQEVLVRVLAAETGIRVSTTTMSRLLKRCGVRRGRPKPIVACPWKKARKTRRLNQIRRIIAGLASDEMVVYVDEVDIHLNPKIGPDYMLPGVQRTVLTPGKNQKRYLAGALDVRSGRLTWVESDRKNSDLFLALVARLLQENPHVKRIYLILDNYKIHDSQRVKLTLAKYGERIERVFLPPYCPDDNRIERLWKDLHDNVTRNHCCETMKELMREVRCYLRRRQRTLRHEYVRRRAA